MIGQKTNVCFWFKHNPPLRHIACKKVRMIDLVDVPNERKMNSERLRHRKGMKKKEEQVAMEIELAKAKNMPRIN